jgi:hypothetical protein
MKWKTALAFVAGYGYSIVLGHFLIYFLIRSLWRGLGYEHGSENDLGHREHPKMVGVLERTLYSAAWQFRRPEFIAVWLALKVAARWNLWSEDKEVGGRIVSGRSVFNIFLIGNGFSICYGVMGALMSEWMKEGPLARSLVIPGILVVGTLAFWLWARAFEARPTAVSAKATQKPNGTLKVC